MDATTTLNEALHAQIANADQPFVAATSTGRSSAWQSVWKSEAERTADERALVDRRIAATYGWRSARIA